MSETTPTLAIDIRTSAHHPDRPQPEDQITLTSEGRAFGQGRVTTVAGPQVAAAWVRIANVRPAEGSAIAVSLGGRPLGEGRIAAVTENYVEVILPTRGA